MSMEDPEIACHLTPLDTVEPGDESFPGKMFFIEVEASFIFALDDSTAEDEDEDEDENWLNLDFPGITTYHTFSFEANRLLCQETSVSAINGMLLQSGVPVRPFMVERILDCTRRMASDELYSDRKVMRFRVNIDVPPMELVDDEGDSDQDSESDPGPETSAAIRAALGKVKVIDAAKQCPICLDEIQVGSEAISMPCLHLYHGHCIDKWLEKSRFCPLCRFEIA